MKKYLILFGGIVLLCLGAVFAYNYVVGLPSQSSQGFQQQISETTVSTNQTSNPVSYKVETVAENLYVPWSLVFTSPTRMLFTERDGNVRVIENGVLKPEALITIRDLSTGSEQGLMGMVAHPNYEQNKYIYMAYAYPDGNFIKVRISRYKDNGSSLSEDKVILENIPAESNHAGTRLGFGPDGKLYIATGDASQKELAMDMKSLAGKTLRVNDDGTVPSDNPTSGSYVYTYGHRNPQGLSWNLANGDLWQTEHGPSVFDGPAGGDEVNLLIAGKGYGWPEVSHEETDPRYESPKVVYTPAVAPASALFYSGKMFPQFKNTLFFGGLRGTGVYWVQMDESGKNVVSKGRLEDINVGRVRDVIEGPDGSIYFSSSNQDGRGSPATGDDKIYRIVKE